MHDFLVGMVVGAVVDVRITVTLAVSIIAIAVSISVTITKKDAIVGAIPHAVYR